MKTIHIIGYTLMQYVHTMSVGGCRTVLGTLLNCIQINIIFNLKKNEINNRNQIKILVLNL